MRLFHATALTLLPGHIVEATQSARAYPDVVELLELRRPSAAPSRDVCVFAADNVDALSVYMAGQQIEVYQIYEVEAEGFHKSPMRIIHEIHVRKSEGKPFDGLVSEYWAPTRAWAFYEYFGPRFEIIQAVPRPDLVRTVVFKMQYEQTDLPLSKSL